MQKKHASWLLSCQSIVALAASSAAAVVIVPTCPPGPAMPCSAADAAALHRIASLAGVGKEQEGGFLVGLQKDLS